MSLTQQMLEAYPAETGMPPQLLAQAVDKLYECAGACLACADAASAEQDPQTIAMSMKCMRTDHDAADLCTVAARVLARQTGYDSPTTMAVIEATRAALRASSDACEEFKDIRYCALSAKACRETEKLLAQLVDQMTSSNASDRYPEAPPSATTPVGASMNARDEAPKKSGMSEEELHEMHVDELRDLARKEGVSGISAMRKEELIDAIRETYRT